MFSWSKAVFLSWIFIFSCQSTDRKPSQVSEVIENQEVKTYDRLADYTPYKYEVLFTDPECGVYKYKATAQIKTKSGKPLIQKPENVYCKNRYDLSRSGSRSGSPQFRIIEWINDSATKEIFFTYLSFKNTAVKSALCAAAKRGVKIKFVISSTADKTAAQELVACSPEKCTDEESWPRGRNRLRTQ